MTGYLKFIGIVVFCSSWGLDAIAQMVPERAWTVVNMTWHHEWWEPMPTVADEVVVDNEGRLIMSGLLWNRIDFDDDRIAEIEFDSTFTNNNYIASFNKGGEFKWVYQIGNTYPSWKHRLLGGIGYPDREKTSVATDDDNNVYLTGLTRGTEDFNGDGIADIQYQDFIDGRFQFLAKYDEAGVLQWVKALKDTYLEYVQIAYDSINEGLYVAGNPVYTCEVVNEEDICNEIENQVLEIQYLDMEGELEWKYKSPEQDTSSYNYIHLRDIAVSHEGGLYLSARFGGAADLDGDGGLNPLVAVVENKIQDSGFFFAKFDSDGEVTVLHRLYNKGYNSDTNIYVDETGDVLLPGKISIPGLDSTTVADLVKLNPNGELVWMKDTVVPDSIGKVGYEDVIINEDDEIIVAGVCSLHEPGFEVGCLFKLSSNGEFIKLYHIHREFEPFDFNSLAWIRRAPENIIYSGGIFTGGAIDPDASGPIPPFTPVHSPRSTDLYFLYFGPPVNISVEDQPEVPSYLVQPASPNPFQTSTSITIRLEKPDYVKVTLYDILGRQVKTAYSGFATSGTPQQIEIDAGNLSSGLYFYQVELQSAPPFVGKLHLVK